MSTKARTEIDLIGSAGGLGSEPGGRAERLAGGAPASDLPLELREELSNEVIDQLLAGARTEEEIVGPGGVLAQLTKRLFERALQAELTEHLGSEPHQEPPGGVGNTRNGATAKMLATEHGPVEINTPRDRNATFEPQIVRKGRRRFEGIDDQGRVDPAWCLPISGSQGRRPDTPACQVETADGHLGADAKVGRVAAFSRTCGADCMRLARDRRF